MAMVSTPRERRTSPDRFARWDDYERYRDRAIDLLMVFTVVGLAVALYWRPGDSSALRQDEWLVLAASGLVLFLSRLRRSILFK
ncbi:hypothetical protein [Singulisphaera acidiphila]|uniref:Uncharacterized protein n=1 Tax=Singulisphaera acidiphila (strain ATCC BAA-1392 / DSM 18658 / VKM B-2454 / MOB10) TaxID=886293 RepID=L0DR23_SINAD|nr:hypothetical protein [Singulisphaera acidiphila]AGA31450.1 hypothetical protein Sinac_7412 [Singulisphaera acidiphila DSM 18658]